MKLSPIEHFNIAYDASIVETVTKMYRDNKYVFCHSETNKHVQKFIDFISVQPYGGGGDVWIDGWSVTASRIIDLCNTSDFNIDAVYDHIKHTCSLTPEMIICMKRHVTRMMNNDFMKMYFFKYMPTNNSDATVSHGWIQRFNLTICEYTCGSVLIGRHTPEFVICYDFFIELVKKYNTIIANENIQKLLNELYTVGKLLHVDMIDNPERIDSIIVKIVTIVEDIHVDEIKQILKWYFYSINKIYSSVSKEIKKYALSRPSIYHMIGIVRQNSGYAPESFDGAKIIYDGIITDCNQPNYYKLTKKMIFNYNPELLDIVLNRIKIHINDLILYNELLFDAAYICNEITMANVF